MAKAWGWVRSAASRFSRMNASGKLRGEHAHRAGDIRRTHNGFLRCVNEISICGVHVVWYLVSSSLRDYLLECVPKFDDMFPCSDTRSDLH